MSDLFYPLPSLAFLLLFHICLSAGPVFLVGPVIVCIVYRAQNELIIILQNYAAMIIEREKSSLCNPSVSF